VSPALLRGVIVDSIRAPSDSICRFISVLVSDNSTITNADTMIVLQCYIHDVIINP